MYGCVGECVCVRSLVCICVYVEKSVSSVFDKVRLCVCQFLHACMVESKISNVWLTPLLQHVHFANYAMYIFVDFKNNRVIC